MSPELEPCAAAIRDFVAVRLHFIMIAQNSMCPKLLLHE